VRESDCCRVYGQFFINYQLDDGRNFVRNYTVERGMRRNKKKMSKREEEIEKRKQTCKLIELIASSRVKLELKLLYFAESIVSMWEIRFHFFVAAKKISREVASGKKCQRNAMCDLLLEMLIRLINLLFMIYEQTFRFQALSLALTLSF
jgi:hypothetical protein